MMVDFINVGLAFLEGFALIISPCILPILPIILAGSLEGNKKRPIGIVIGFVISFALFTFFSRQLVEYSGIDLSLIRYISYALLLLFGIVMLSSYLTEKFAASTQSLANVGSTLTTVNNPQGGFYSGILFGALVGLIWTPCAGPILAAVIVQSVVVKTAFLSFLIILAFGIGAAIPMLIIALFGRTILGAFSVFRNHAVLFRKILGVIIILSVILMIYGGSSYTFIPNKPISIAEISHPKLIDALDYPYKAPAIDGITGWVNSPPLTLNQLKGKVVLIDFWTYSCINCIRTLPYLKDWYAKYHDKGFEIIGVHSPEFEFEKNFDNVKDAVQKDGIKYPVVLDSNYVTWGNYHNHYWPAHYLIDKNGNIVYEHFGEGDYATTENNIRFLLGLNKTTNPSNFETEGNAPETPETYLGYARMETYSSPEQITNDKPSSYSFPANLSENDWALSGNWIVKSENIVSAASNAALEIHFYARKVFAVMGNSTGSPIDVRVLLNGKPVVDGKGKDVIDSKITVNRYDLFEVLSLPESSRGRLELIADAPGLMVYTFTFGS